MRHRATKSRRRWARLVAWWSVVTVVLVCVQVGALMGGLYWLPRARPGLGTVGLAAKYSGITTSLRIQVTAISRFAAWCDGAMVLYAMQSFPAAEVENPSCAEDLMPASYIEVKAPPAVRVFVMRFRDWVGPMAIKDSWGFNARALELRCGVTLGVVMISTGVTTVLSPPPTADYPMAFTMRGGRAMLALRPLSIVGLAGGVSAGIIGMGASIGAGRRAIRRRRKQCTACGYSVVGIAEDTPCPECGAARDGLEARPTVG